MWWSHWCVVLLASSLLALCSSSARGDWAMDLVRFQCLPEIGRILIESIEVSNPDDFGFFHSSGGDEKKVRRFEDKNQLYVAGRSRTFDCTLGTVPVKAQFDYATNSQGQAVGSFTAFSRGRLLINGLPIAAYRPDVQTLTIVAVRRYPGNTELYDLYASLVILDADAKRIEHQTKLGDKVLDSQWLSELASKGVK